MLIKEKASDDLMIEEIREAHSFEAHLVEEQYIQKFFEHLNATLIFSSTSAGLGKSAHIKNLALDYYYQRVPIQGNLTKSSQIKLHVNKQVNSLAG